MSSITTISANDFSEMIAGSIAHLGKNVEQVNNLNVFPVPDGDTGTNMMSTIRGAGTVSISSGVSLGDFSGRAAGAMMRASRGNSGVILSLFFRGVAKVFAGCERADAALFVSAFRTGAKSAASAVQKPVEGTILTVMRECCAEDIATDDISELMAVLIERAEKILAKTPEMLPALKKAKVVDSGGQGFVIILKGMKSALDGEKYDVTAIPDAEVPASEVSAAGADTSEIIFAYCTECMLEKREGEPEYHSELHEWLDGMGDSIVYVEDDEIIKLHIHTNEPLVVLSKVGECGTFEKCKIENMKIQHSNLISGQSAPKDKQEQPKEEEKPERSGYALVAVYSGKGMSDALHEAGVREMVNGGKSMNPSTDDIIDAIKKCNAETVFVLPNNKNTVLAARQAAAMLEGEGIDIRVIPTHSVPEGIAAAMAFNASRTVEDNEKYMNDAAGEIVSLALTRAVRPAETNELSIKKNQYIGIIGGTICVAEDSMSLAIEKLIRKVDDKDCYTVYYGADVSAKEVSAIEDLIVSIVPDADVSMVPGGQKIYTLIISAE